MGYPGNKVETTYRLAQWRIRDSNTCPYRKSDPFKIAMWNWVLELLDRDIKLYPEMSNISTEIPPIVSLRFNILKSIGNRKPLTHSEIKDKLIMPNEFGFVWPDIVPRSPNFIIDIEFLDLKMASPKDETYSIWDDQIMLQKASNAAALQSLGVMLAEHTHADIMVNAADGSVQAHRAVLAARSPVFNSLISYNVEEKKLSGIDIPDMSVEACQAFVNYLYGSIKHEDFMAYRLLLLHAAYKYDVPDLKEVCHESLLKDINSKNVLDRLQNAFLYALTELKMYCIKYLVSFGRLYDIHDDFKEFMEHADRDLITEIMAEMITSWN